MPFLNSARNASIDPMILPTALADIVISSEAFGTLLIDSELSKLEKGNDSLLESASMIATTIDSAERTAKTLNAVRGAIGRSERRLQSLKYLLNASLGYMQDASHSNAAAAQSQQWDSAQRILRAHNANMRSDVEHLLLQVWNNNVRVQTQQQVVRVAFDQTIVHRCDREQLADRVTTRRCTTS
jgi:ribulose bisphosphate carboxylase small subunit